jgi:hypothetical protein
MLSAGVLFALGLAAALVLVSMLGLRLDGWGGVVLGAAGMFYCYTAAPSRMVLVVLPLSLLFLLVGGVTLAVRNLRKST